MEKHLTFIIVVVVIVALYQAFYILISFAECKKLIKVKQTGKQYRGVVTKVNKNYLKFSSNCNIYTTITLDDGEEKQLSNWPKARRSPYPVGSKVDVYYSKEYPNEYIFADDTLETMRFLSPIQDDKLDMRFIAVRSVLVWICAIAIIAFVIFIQR